MPEPIVIKGLICIAALGLFYVLLLRVAANWAYPLRERLFSLGDELLKDDRLTGDEHEFICHALRNAMAYRTAILWFVGAFVIIAIAFGQLFGGPGLPKARTNTDLRVKISEFIDLYMRSVFAANPIFGLLAAIAMRGALVASWAVRPTDSQAARSKMAEYAANHATI